MKVYVLTKGEYSGYHVVGVFSSEEAVAEYIGKCKDAVNTEDVGTPFNDHEEYELDVVPEQHILVPAFAAKINFESGDITYVQGCKMFVKDSDRDSYYEWLWEKEGDTTATASVSYSTISQEHANKLAAEQRQEFIRVRDLRMARL